jgi:hypothetical protein
MVVDGLLKDSPRPLAFGFQGAGFFFGRACDLKPTCQFVLEQHGDGFAPACVFNNILDRVLPEDLAQLRAIEAQWDQQIAERLNAAPSKAEKDIVVKVCCDQMMDELCNALESMVLLRTAYCTKHNKQCCLDQRSCGADCRIWQAGNSCLDWSSMGSRKQWAGSGCLPCIVWCFHVLQERPEIIIEECTPRFDLSLMTRILGQLYNIRARVLCPTHLGQPTARPRQWTVFTLKSRVKCLFEFDHPDFERLFHRKMQLTGDIYCVESEDCVAAQLQKLVAKRKLPTGRFALDYVLPPAKRMRLRGLHLLAQTKPRLAKEPCLLANLEQSPDAIVQMQLVVPTLLQASTICVLKSDRVKTPRLLTPAEHMVCMGWPLHNASLFGLSQGVATSIRRLPDNEVKKLAGNGMHVAVCGVVLLYVLACTDLVAAVT